MPDPPRMWACSMCFSDSPWCGHREVELVSWALACRREDLQAASVVVGLARGAVVRKPAGSELGVGDVKTFSGSGG